MRTLTHFTYTACKKEFSQRPARGSTCNMWVNQNLAHVGVDKKNLRNMTILSKTMATQILI